MFAIIFIYFFTNKLVGGLNDANCTYLFECFSLIFDTTFKFNGGFSGIFQIPYFNYSLDLLTVINFLYNMLSLLLVLSILTGKNSSEKQAVFEES